MENYIVRIYRRDKSDPNKLTGVCESVEQETRSTFSTLSNLMSLISPARVVADENATGEDSIPELRSKAISMAD
ncbi:MAG: hypothetical protein ABF297_05510 [Thiogranum sp.]